MMLKRKIYVNLQLTKRKYSKSIFQSVVGLEVHAQINSVSKLFSGASTSYSSPVNNNVSFFDCSVPGTLPVLNRRCVEAGVLTALALNCQVNPISLFDRKHYFYADLPVGYQITQQRAPLAVNGNLEFLVYSPAYQKVPYTTSVRIKQLQLEQDSGKSLHDEHRSLVDLNRAGVPLMELVFDPDLKDGEEAAALVKELRQILMRLNTCSCKMEEGAMRVDANVSINRKGEPLGVRTEIKNISSVRGVAAAVDYEIKRQITVKQTGGTIVNETRSWDTVNKVTVPMRDKEVLQDYRYMPEPNLPPLHVAMGPVTTGCVNADELRKSIPELPKETRDRLKTQIGLSVEQAIVLVNDPQLLKIFEEAVKRRRVTPKILANFLINDLYKLLHKNNMESSDIKCPSDYVGEIVELIESSRINRNTANVLLEDIVTGSSRTPIDIVTARGLFQITDESQLRRLCLEVLEENGKAVKDFKAGKTKAFKALLGGIAGKSGNKADMAKCIIILRELLKS